MLEQDTLEPCRFPRLLAQRYLLKTSRIRAQPVGDRKIGIGKRDPFLPAQGNTDGGDVDGVGFHEINLHEKLL